MRSSCPAYPRRSPSMIILARETHLPAYGDKQSCTDFWLCALQQRRCLALRCELRTSKDQRSLWTGIRSRFMRAISRFQCACAELMPPRRVTQVVPKPQPRWLHWLKARRCNAFRSAAAHLVTVARNQPIISALSRNVLLMASTSRRRWYAADMPSIGRGSPVGTIAVTTKSSPRPRPLLIQEGSCVPTRLRLLSLPLTSAEHQGSP